MPDPKWNAKPRVVWQPLPGSQALAIACPADEFLYHGTRGPGKRISNTTPVLTDSGWKNAGDVAYSDKLCAMDGTFAPISGIFPCKDRELWNVEFMDGSVVEADDEHRWLTLNGKSGYKEGWKIRTTLELRGMKTSCSIPYLSGGIEGPTWTGIDPYLVGYVIANGTTGSKHVTVYSIDGEILSYFAESGWSLYSYEQTAKRAVCLNQTEGDAIRELIGNCTAAYKRIPPQMLAMDRNSRLALLQGLMDGDGNFEKGAQSRYTTVSEQLAQDVVYLVKSLGGWASYRRTEKKGGFNGDSWAWAVNLSHHNLFNPFRVERKASRVLPQKKFLTRGIRSITYSRQGDGVCFAIDHPSHCFLCGDFVVTHNTDAQLMKFRRYVGLGYGKYWRGVIFDREYKNLDDLVAKSKKWFPQFNDGAFFKESPKDYKWVWPTGEELLFRAGYKESDYDAYHGHEYPFIGFNELTKQPNRKFYDAMHSCNRCSFLPYEHTPKDEKGRYLTPDRKPLPEIPLIFFSTTNPHGSGHTWVKTQFIDRAPPGVIVKLTRKVFNPRTQQEEDVTRTQTHLFGSYKENRYLSPAYVAMLDAESDPNKRKAWLEGDWDIVAGGALDDVWKSEVHVIPRFKVPLNWRLDRSFDWGSSQPYSVGIWAEANGEAVEVTGLDGKKFQFCPVRGSIIRVAEIYGTKEIGSNDGTKEGAKDIAKKIASLERRLREQGWIAGDVLPGPADNAIHSKTEKDTDTIAKIMADWGVRWTASDKSKGSRINGLELVRGRFRASLTGEGQGIYFMDNCRAAISTLPVLPRDPDDPDDVDTEAEDHVYDEVRYRVLAGSNRLATSIKATYPV